MTLHLIVISMLLLSSPGEMLEILNAVVTLLLNKIMFVGSVYYIFTLKYFLS